MGSLPLVVVCTFWLLPSEGGSILATLGIELFATAIAMSLLWLPWARLPASLLMVFPGILALSLISTAHLQRDLAASYVGFLTISFLYIGITQSRVAPILAVPIAIPIYLLCAIHVTPAINVRLPIAVVIWLLIGEVMADRSARNRKQNSQLATQANNDALTGLMSRIGFFAKSIGP